jgi:prephenate dehydrogenase
LNEAQPLTDEAGRLGAVYAMETRRIAQNPGMISDASRELKAALTAETLRFRKAMELHERSIERQRMLAEGLVRAIAEEAVAARPTPVAYGPGSGAFRDTTAVALDRRA